jgi:hypothetical protein
VLLREQQEEMDARFGYTDLFSYVDLEQRVPANHPLRLIRRIVNEVPAALDSEFGRLYAGEGRPSIAPERASAGAFVAGVRRPKARLALPYDGQTRSPTRAMS